MHGALHGVEATSHGVFCDPYRIKFDFDFQRRISEKKGKVQNWGNEMEKRYVEERLG